MIELEEYIKHVKEIQDDKKIFNLNTIKVEYENNGGNISRHRSNNIKK